MSYKIVLKVLKLCIGCDKVGLKKKKTFNRKRTNFTTFNGKGTLLDKA